MKQIKKIIALVAAGTMVCSMLSACGGSTTASNNSTNSTATTAAAAAATSEAEKVEVGGGVVEGNANTGMVDNVIYALNDSSFDVGPFGGASGARDTFVSNLYGALICIPYFGASLEDCQNWMAKNIEKVDDYTYKVEIYDNIIDSQGNAITAEDIKFSYAECAKVGQPECITTCINDVEKDIEVVDDYNMIFHFAKIGSGIVENLFGNYRMCIVDKEWYENASDDDKINNIATTGAYTVKSYTPGDSLVVTYNENYWQQDDSLNPIYGKHNVKTITYKVISEASMRTIAIENGEVDVATKVSASEVYRFYADEAMTKPAEGYNILVQDAAGFNCVMLNMDENSKSPLAKDENLRKAVLYCMDSESLMLASGCNENQGQVSKAFATDIMGGWVDSWNNVEDYYTYDLDKAAEYLAASDYSDGVELVLCDRTSTTDAQNSVFIANLEAIGIKVKLLCVDQALFNTYRYDSSQWDIFFDSKRSSGYVTDIWDILFNPSGYQNGDACFNHDDELVSVLQTAVTQPTEENLTKFSDYLYGKACVKALYKTYNYVVAQDGILEQTMSSGLNPYLPAYVFSDSYKSVAK